MVPHVRDRPLALQAFPKGVGGERLLRQERAEALPRLDRHGRTCPSARAARSTRCSPTTRRRSCTSAGQNAITLHVWTSRAGSPRAPGPARLRPRPPRSDFAEVRAAARGAGELLRDIGLVPFAMTTGSRGLHVVAPLRRTADYEEVHAFARGAVAEPLAAEHPDTPDERVPPREARRPHLPRHRTATPTASTPSRRTRCARCRTPRWRRRWSGSELDDPKLDPQGWSITTVLERLADLGGDPWAGIARDARALAGPRKALG